METTGLSEAGDWKAELHGQFFDWCTDHVKNKNAQYELACAYRAWIHQGWFSIHTGRIDFAHGGTTKRAIRNALTNCPYINPIAKARQGVSCAKYRFVDLAGLRADDAEKSGAKKWPTEYTFLSPISLPSSLSSSLLIPHSWYLHRALQWKRWCESRGHELRVDLFGTTSTGRSVFEAIESIEVPTDHTWLSVLSDNRSHPYRLSPREHARAYHRWCLSGRVVRRVRRLSGRIYHWFTQCSRTLRRLLRIDGEPLVEVDLSASYFTLVAGKLAPSQERQRLIDILTSGQWYEWLMDHSPSGYADLDELKVAAQRDLLFAHDWRVRSRPLWSPVARAFPSLARFIAQQRARCGGPSGFAHYLTTLEGRVMNPAYEAITAQHGRLALPLHDGILCGVSDAELVADTIRSLGRAELGFEPLVRTKTK